MTDDRILIGVVRDDGSKLDFDYPDDYRALIKEFAGSEVEIEIRKRRSTRSDRQSRWMHSFLRPLAKHLGMTLEELKLVGLVGVWGTHEVMGYTVPVRPRTRDLNTDEHSDLCEWFIEKAAGLDPPFLVLYPEEFRRKKQKLRIHIPDPIEVDQRIQRGMAPR